MAKKKSKKIPAWVWLAVAAVVLLFIYVWHQNSSSQKQQGGYGSAVPKGGAWQPRGKRGKPPGGRR